MPQITHYFLKLQRRDQFLKEIQPNLIENIVFIKNFSKNYEINLEILFNKKFLHIYQLKIFCFLKIFNKIKTLMKFLEKLNLIKSYTYFLFIKPFYKF